MIKYRNETEDILKNNKPIKTYKICPQCLNEDWFYNFCATKCTECGMKSIDYFALSKRKNRVEYHFKGEL